MRLRVTFSKTGPLRYTSHLDLHKVWERTARRARLPLAYSQGFHPQPKMQLAAALPLGFIGRAEILDMWLECEAYEASRLRIPEVLQSAAPPGLTILHVEQVDEREPALQTRLDSAEYEVTLLDPVDESKLSRCLSAIMGAKSLPRERRGKPLRGAFGVSRFAPSAARPSPRPETSPSSVEAAWAEGPPRSQREGAQANARGRLYDLRPLIHTLSLLPTDKNGWTRLFLRLSAREGATGRPEEVLAELGIAFENTRIERTRLIFRE